MRLLSKTNIADLVLQRFDEGTVVWATDAIDGTSICYASHSIAFEYACLFNRFYKTKGIKLKYDRPGTSGLFFRTALVQY